jgi:MFS family permease
MSSKIKHIVFATGGNFIQWFDNTLFFVMLPLLIYNFTPKNSGIENLLNSLITFSATLLSRPFGAIIFSNLSDHFGRKQIMILTVFLMGASTLFLSICPDENIIGVAAPAFLLLFTFLHGFASGGEWPNSSCYIYEITDESKKIQAGFIASVQLILGLFLSNVLISLFVESKSYFFVGMISWRILFFISSMLAFFLTQRRFHLQESPKWHKAKEKFHFLKCLQQNRKNLLVSFALSAIDGVMFNSFLSIEYPFAALSENRAYSLVSTFFVLICGYFLYRVVKKLGQINSLKLALFLIIFLALIDLGINDPAIKNFLRITFSLSAFLYLIPLPTLQPALFPPEYRAFCIGLSRTMSIFIFGGLGMIYLKYKVFSSHQVFSIYVLGTCLISYIAVFLLGKKRLNLY